MKKLILSITALAALTFSGYSQCTPDPQFTLGGIYPDSATGLPAAYVGYAYDEVITVVVPLDTIADIPFFGPTVVPFVDITLDNVNGLPPNFGYTCSPSNCVFLGDSEGCVNLTSSVNPTASDIGVYSLTIDVTATVDVLGTPTPQSQTINYYYIEIIDSASMSIGTYNDESFELKTIYPNPVVDNSSIQFISGKSQQVTFTVMNVLGKTMINRSISANKGVNELTISSEDFSNGIYLYSITADGKTSTKRMVIRK